MQSRLKLHETKIAASPKPVELSAELTDTSATLTFHHVNINSDDNPCNKSTYLIEEKNKLDYIQAEIHPDISAANFIHPFRDSDTEPAKINKFVFAQFDSAFGSMAHTAFGKHKPIELRPDDIHLLIMQGIARFLQKFPEDFRQSVAPFEGKQKIKVYITDVNDAGCWNKMPKRFAALLRQRVSVPEVVDLLLQNYSDTTETDKTVKAITLMGTFSAYFDYMEATMCHIPKFILKGTVADWDKLQMLPEKFIAQLNLSDSLAPEQETGPHLLHRWLTRLQPILHGMYLGRQGKTDIEFWQSFYKYKSYSGGNAVTGNIVYFYPFLKRPHFRNDLEDIRINEYILKREVTLGRVEGYHVFGPRTDELTANFIEVDLLLETQQNDKILCYNMGMKGGIVAYKEESETKMLSTHVEYSIFYKSRTPTGLKPAQTDVYAKGQLQQRKDVQELQPSAVTAIASANSKPKTETVSGQGMFAAQSKKKIQVEVILDSAEENLSTQKR